MAEHIYGKLIWKAKDTAGLGGNELNAAMLRSCGRIFGIIHERIGTLLLQDGRQAHYLPNHMIVISTVEGDYTKQFRWLELYEPLDKIPEICDGREVQWLADPADDSVLAYAKRQNSIEADVGHISETRSYSGVYQLYEYMRYIGINSRAQRLHLNIGSGKAERPIVVFGPKTLSKENKMPAPITALNQEKETKPLLPPFEVGEEMGYAMSWSEVYHELSNLLGISVTYLLKDPPRKYTLTNGEHWFQHVELGYSVKSVASTDGRGCSLFKPVQKKEAKLENQNVQTPDPFPHGAELWHGEAGHSNENWIAKLTELSGGPLMAYQYVRAVNARAVTAGPSTAMVNWYMYECGLVVAFSTADRTIRIYAAPETPEAGRGATAASGEIEALQLKLAEQEKALTEYSGQLATLKKENEDLKAKIPSEGCVVFNPHSDKYGDLCVAIPGLREFTSVVYPDNRFDDDGPFSLNGGLYGAFELITRLRESVKAEATKVCVLHKAHTELQNTCDLLNKELEEQFTAVRIWPSTGLVKFEELEKIFPNLQSFALAVKPGTGLYSRDTRVNVNSALREAVVTVEALRKQIEDLEARSASNTITITAMKEQFGAKNIEMLIYDAGPIPYTTASQLIDGLTRLSLAYRDAFAPLCKILSEDYGAYKNIGRAEAVQLATAWLTAFLPARDIFKNSLVNAR